MAVFVGSAVYIKQSFEAVVQKDLRGTPQLRRPAGTVLTNRRSYVNEG